MVIVQNAHREKTNLFNVLQRIWLRLVAWIKKQIK